MNLGKIFAQINVQKFLCFTPTAYFRDQIFVTLDALNIVWIEYVKNFLIYKFSFKFHILYFLNLPNYEIIQVITSNLNLKKLIPSWIKFPFLHNISQFFDVAQLYYVEYYTKLLRILM